MFKELFSDFETLLKQANKTTKRLSNTIKQTKSQLGIQDQHHVFDPTQEYGHVVSFGKSQRFKPLIKEQLKITDLSIDGSLQLNINKSVKSHTFKKSQRFDSNNKVVPTTIINPNFNFVKKNNQIGPVIKKTVLNELQKSKVSQVTAATSSEDVGPGSYFIKEQIKNKNSSFSKGKRFEGVKKVNEDIPLFPKDTLTKKRPPSSAMLKQKVQKTKQIISIENQQQARQRLKMIYWNSIPLQIDRLFKNKSGPILKSRYFDIQKLKGRQRKCAMLMLLEQLNFARGGFDLNIRTQLNQPCAAIYRKSLPKPFKFSEMEPGPDFYYPQDDIIRPHAHAFSFGKATDKKMEIDNRDYEVNQNIMKKGGNIIINPQHKFHVLTEQQIRQLNRGPGFYDCLFKLVEKRNDIGSVKLAALNEHNSRQNNLGQKKQVNDIIYYPSYEQIDKNIGVPLYRENANVEPPNLPDKVLFPQHWLFYDGDLNKVRAEIAKNVLLSKNMPYDQYQEYSRKFKVFQNYLKSRKFQPQVGEYNVKFTEVDKHIPNYELNKQPDRQINCQGIVKEEGEVDGDNLILQPDIPNNHLPNIQFNKMVGRQTDTLPQDQARQGDILLLNPKKNQKKIPDIKFQKMAGREMEETNEQAPQGDRVIVNPKYPQKHIPNIDFKKQSQRPPIIKENDPEKPQIILNPQSPKKIKGFVDLSRLSSVRLVPRLREQKQKQKQKDSIKKEQNNKQQD